MKEEQRQLLDEDTPALLSQLQDTGLEPTLRARLDTLRTIASKGANTRLYTLRSSSQVDPSGSNSSVRSLLLIQSRTVLVRLVQTTQEILLKAVQEPLATPMLVYSSLPVWTWVEPNQTDEGVSIPSFSLSPTETVAGLGEALLDLPRALEVYAQDPALAFGIHALPHLNLVVPDTTIITSTTTSSSSITFNNGPTANTDASQAPNRPRTHERRTSLLITPPPPGATPSQQQEQQQQQQQPPDPVLGPGEVLSLWLLSILRSFLARLTGEILPGLPRLSPHGTKQLATDLDYLESILAVLNYVQLATDELDAWRRAVSLEEQTFKVLASGASGADDGPGGHHAPGEVLIELRKTRAFAQVGRLRGYRVVGISDSKTS